MMVTMAMMEMMPDMPAEMHPKKQMEVRRRQSRASTCRTCRAVVCGQGSLTPGLLFAQT